MYDDLSNTAPRLVPREGKMYFQRSGFPALSLKNRFCMGHILKPLLTKQLQTRRGWLSVFLSFYGPQKRNTDLGPNIQTSWRLVITVYFYLVSLVHTQHPHWMVTSLLTNRTVRQIEGTNYFWLSPFSWPHFQRNPLVTASMSHTGHTILEIN